LRENDLIRVIDALVVEKTLDGDVVALSWSDLSIEEAEDFGATIGALLGLGVAGEAGLEAGAMLGFEAGSDGHVIDEERAWDVAAQIPEGGVAAIVLLEHLWAAPLRSAIARAGGVPISDGWVHPLDLVEIGLLAADELDEA
jgi:uncharacterized membrane protein